MRTAQKPEPSAGDYAREAIAQWGQAAHGAAAALRARREARAEKPPLSERLNPATTAKGGRIGDAADWLLSKTGAPGKLASKLSLGSRMVERMRPGDGGGDDGDERRRDDSAQESAGGSAEPKPAIPIQESVDVAIPLRAAWELSTRFEDYPEFAAHIDAAEADGDRVSFEGPVRGHRQATEIEIIEAHAEQRIDWEGRGAFEHSGAVSFHSLAPGLTRIELSIDVAPQGLLERASRRLGFTERAIRGELRRFKAYAELWQDVEEPVADEEEPETEDRGQDEEPRDGVDEDEDDFDEDEKDFDEGEEIEDEEDLDDEAADDFDDEESGEDEEYEEEEYEDELEPARSR